MTCLALTMGEPSGIGSELALMAWRTLHDTPNLAFALYGNIDLMRARARTIGCDINIAEATTANACSTFANALPVIPIKNKVQDCVGSINPANAPAVIEAIEQSVADVHAGLMRAVVTNPIQKSSLTAHGFKWPGQTEYLGALDEAHTGQKTRAVMMLACDELKIVPLTIHIPLKDVASTISTQDIMNVARITADALKNKFGYAQPRLVVAGLNPHAGEQGTMGREDIDIIAPAVAQLQQEGLNVRGPLPADTLFHAQARQTYDGVIAMYHDQALIPVKTLAFDSAVNLTLGLSFIRTSPDHGTALDIAGQGIARPDSLIAAIKLAHDLSFT